MGLKYSVYLEEIYYYLWLPWQESFIAQPPQPHEQELLPCFLLRIPVITIARNITAIIAVIIIVGIISKLLLLSGFHRKYIIVIFIGADYQEDHKCKHYKRNGCPKGKSAAGKEHTELIYHKGNGIGEDTHISDSCG